MSAALTVGVTVATEVAAESSSSGGVATTEAMTRVTKRKNAATRTIAATRTTLSTHPGRRLFPWSSPVSVMGAKLRIDESSMRTRGGHVRAFGTALGGTVWQEAIEGARSSSQGIRIRVHASTGSARTGEAGAAVKGTRSWPWLLGAIDSSLPLGMTFLGIEMMQRLRQRWDSEQCECLGDAGIRRFWGPGDEGHEVQRLAWSGAWRGLGPASEARKSRSW